MNDVNQVLTALELDHLSEVREVTNTVNTSGWHRIIKQVEAFVDEAHEDMLGNVSPDPMNAVRLQMRWQQREVTLRGIRHYVKSCEDEKQQLLLQARQSVPLGEEYAEQD